VAVLKSANGLLILLLDLCESFIPTLVELLVLHKVCLLDLFTFAGLLINKLLASACEILYLEFLNAVLCHLCLNILALSFTLLAVVFKDSTIS
jgi:hypothetical protein